jgi:DNA polymerase I-like protein with 3'-5' exonuclease and polymerase domains
MIALFKDGGGGDIYRRMASVCFRKPLPKISKCERQQAKAISLGIIYGLGAKHLASQLNEHMLRDGVNGRGGDNESSAAGVTATAKTFSEKDAKKLIASWFACFPAVRAFMSRTIALAKHKGYV